MASSCSDFLDIKPNGVLDESDINGPDQADGMVVAAYSMLGNDHYDYPWSMWPFGNVRSDDAYKGGRDEADIQDFHFLETCSNILPTFSSPDIFWYQCYIGIARCNRAINILSALSETEYPKRNQRIAECLFLRVPSSYCPKKQFADYIDKTDDIHHPDKSYR